MIDFLSNYGLFLAKIVTVVVALLIVIAAVASATQKPQAEDGVLYIQHLNEKFNDVKSGIQSEVLSKAEYKAWQKEEKARAKSEQKAQRKNHQTRPRMFVMRFEGDIKASQTQSLIECINAVLNIAKSDDEVLLVLESAGGYVHSYGHAAAQVQRIIQHPLNLTVAIDKCAASGGYLMACLGNTLIASPFAIIGSIGVVGQLPNFNRLLKKHDIDYEQHTAGEFKRTLTVFGENSDKQRKKFIEDIEVTHDIFKTHVAQHRPVVDIHEVATGEHWHAVTALEKKLIDKIQTSESYIMESLLNKEVFEISYQEKQKLTDKFFGKLNASFEHVLLTLAAKRNIFKF